MRFLLFVSGFLFLSGCAPAAYKNLQETTGDVACIQKFKPSIQRALYQTTVDVVGNHLSGILLIKQMPDSSTRIVFTNEAGYSFFDFEFSKQGAFKVYSIIPKMDKEAVTKTLKKDFELVLMNRLNTANAAVFNKKNERYYAYADGEDIYYYISDADCNTLLRMERGNDRKKVLEAYRGALKDGVPETIQIKHSNFKFTIDLKRIYDNVE